MALGSSPPDAKLRCSEHGDGLKAVLCCVTMTTFPLQAGSVRGVSMRLGEYAFENTFKNTFTPRRTERNSVMKSFGSHFHLQQEVFGCPSCSSLITVKQLQILMTTC